MPESLMSWMTGIINLGFAVWVAAFLLTKFNKTLDESIRTNQEFLDMARIDRAASLDVMSRHTAMLEKLVATTEVQTSLLREVLIELSNREK